MGETGEKAVGHCNDRSIDCWLVGLDETKQEQTSENNNRNKNHLTLPKVIDKALKMYSILQVATWALL